MSASSNCVTCGMLTQLACSRGPAIFWMRVSGRRSIGPKAAKSTLGTAGSAASPGRAGAVSSCLTYAFTSSAVIRPLRPVPVMRARSTPSSRAKRRTDGPACAREKPGSSMMGRAAAACVAGTRASLSAAGRSRCRRGDRSGFACASGRRLLRGRRSGRCGCGTCRRRGRRLLLSRLHQRDQVAFRHPIAALDLDLPDRPSRGGRHVHRRLLGLERDERAPPGAMTSPAFTGTSMTSTSL